MDCYKFELLDLAYSAASDTVAFIMACWLLLIKLLVAVNIFKFRSRKMNSVSL